MLRAGTAPGRESWRDGALCAQTDPDAFFPETGHDPLLARMVCAGCQVRSECLDYALSRGERYGVWGGLSERERRRLAATLPGHAA